MNMSFYIYACRDSNSWKCNSTWGKTGWMGEYYRLQNNKKEKRQNHRKIQTRVVDFNALSQDGRTINYLKLHE